MASSRPHPPNLPRLQLYAKPGCHLCDQAEADLARLRRRYPHTLEVVDISQDAELMARFGLRIPVLVIGDREYAAPLEFADIQRALDEALERFSSGTGSPPHVR